MKETAQKYEAAAKAAVDAENLAVIHLSRVEEARSLAHAAYRAAEATFDAAEEDKDKVCVYEILIGRCREETWDAGISYHARLLFSLSHLLLRLLLLLTEKPLLALGCRMRPH